MMLKLLIGAALGSALLFLPVGAQAAAGGERAEGGKQIYERANCVGCHKWSGVGGGGYGGAALSLRGTQLSHDDIVQLVTCGRPGTGMPTFTTDPYKDGACYGLTREDVKDIMPPRGGVVLRPTEIDEVATYVIANIKGKGQPDLTDCVAFFGDTSRVCDIYRPKTTGDSLSTHAMPTPSTAR